MSFVCRRQNEIAHSRGGTARVGLLAAHGPVGLSSNDRSDEHRTDALARDSSGPVTVAGDRTTSGGVSALEGFDYQAIVILEFALAHFEQYADGTVRPEGRDDAELCRPNMPGVRHIQVKKPARTADGARRPITW